MAAPPPSMDEILKGWRDLTLRVHQLEVEKGALEKENKAMRFLLERIIDHRQKSHNELVLILTNLVSKLPLNDVGAIVGRLVEHNTNVCQYLGALCKGNSDVPLPQPEVLKNLEQTRRDLIAALNPVIEDLVRSDPPLDPEMLRSFLTHPEAFFSPRVLRANRFFVKGYLPRERVIKDFGSESMALFNDMTTDPKLNPNPKPDEIAVAFKNDFESILNQNPSLLVDKRQELIALNQRVQRSKAATPEARLQRSAFLRMSFILELLHFYDNQSTEAPDAIFAQRLPSLIEQIVLPGPQERLEKNWIEQAETLLAFVISAEHRQMIVNNIGKAGSAAKTLKFVLRFRTDKAPGPELDQEVAEFVKHLLPTALVPSAEGLKPILGLIRPEIQRLVVRTIIRSDRLRKADAENLGRGLAAALDLKGFDEQIKAEDIIPPEIERQRAWAKIHDLISRRSEAATIATAIRERLSAKYDAEEIKQSWLTLIDADPISFIRVFCQLPYRSDGSTDSIARPVMETYVSRLLHEKYAASYTKVVNSLRNMFHVKPDSPTLVNFLALIRWVNPEAAEKLSHDIGMAVAAQ